jgi:hypothetical protein
MSLTGRQLGHPAFAKFVFSMAGSMDKNNNDDDDNDKFQTTLDMQDTKDLQKTIIKSN